jgi:hypothetical protein
MYEKEDVEEGKAPLLIEALFVCFTITAVSALRKISEP